MGRALSPGELRVGGAARFYLVQLDGRVRPLRLDDAQRECLGPKGAQLLGAALRAGRGLAVPRTLCVPAPLVRQAIGAHPGRRRRYDAWLAGLRRAAEHRRRCDRWLAEADEIAVRVERDAAAYFRTRPLLLKLAGLQGRLAVRSSGYEDLPADSNAGGNRTRLQVAPAELPAALGYVAASVFSSQSVRQRLACAPTPESVARLFPRGLDDLRFAILVQELIDGRGASLDAETGPVVPVLSSRLLRRVLTCIERAARATGGRSPLEVELALGDAGVPVSVAAIRPHPEHRRGVWVECAVGLGQAVAGRAHVTRYECLPVGRRWAVLAWADPRAGSRDIDAASVYLTQVRPHPPRPRSPAASGAGPPQGEVRLRLPAEVIVPGACPPGCGLLVDYSLDQAWRRYLAASRPQGRAPVALVAVHQANRLSHAALMLEHEGVVVLAVETASLAVLGALESRAAELRWDYDEAAGELCVRAADAAGPARFRPRPSVAPEVAWLGGRPRSLAELPEPWRRYTRSAERRLMAERRLRRCATPPVSSYARLARAAHAWTLAGGDPYPYIEDWWRGGPSDLRRGGPPGVWERRRRAALRLRQAGLMGRVSLAAFEAAFSGHERDRTLAGYLPAEAPPALLEAAWALRARLRGAPWVDEGLLARLDARTPTLLRAGRQDWLSLAAALAECSDPAPLLELLAGAAAHGAGPPAAARRWLARYRDAYLDLRDAIERRANTPAQLRRLERSWRLLSGAVWSLGCLARRGRLPRVLERNLFYDATEVCDGLGKLHLARVIEVGRPAVRGYYQRLERWWRWLRRWPHVARQTRAARVARLLGPLGPRQASADRDPARLQPIDWLCLVERRPATLSAHQIHNVLHQFSLHSLTALDEPGALALAARLEAFARGCQATHARLGRTTADSICIELRGVGIHSSVAELTRRGWQFHFAETNLWRPGRNARLHVLEALLRWLARGDRRWRPSAYIHESKLESALHFRLDLAAQGAAFVQLAENAFHHVVAFVDGLWEFSGTPTHAVAAFVGSLERPGVSASLTRAAVAYRERLQAAAEHGLPRRHLYRVFFSVLSEFYASFTGLAPALDRDYRELRGRMLSLLATETAHRFCRRPSLFGLILCMLHPEAVAEELARGSFPAALGRQRAALHLPPGTVWDPPRLRGRP